MSVGVFSFSKNPTEDAVPSYVLYSPQGSRPLEGLHVEGGVVTRYYDKNTRSQLLRISPSARVSFSRSRVSHVGKSGSALTTASQRIIVLQLFCEESARVTFSFMIELLLQDKLARRRILFTTSSRKLQQNAQHVKVPLSCVSPGVWLNIVLDVPSIYARLYSASAGRIAAAELVESRRLLTFTISSSNTCCVRRVLGMPQLPPSYMNVTVANWPLSLRLPVDVPVRFLIIRTCEEEFLRHAEVSHELDRHYEIADDRSESNSFSVSFSARDPRTRQSASLSARYSTHGGLDVAAAENAADFARATTGHYDEGRHGVRTTLAVMQNDFSSFYTNGSQTGVAVTQREKVRRNGKHEGTVTVAALSSRPVSKLYAGEKKNNRREEKPRVMEGEVLCSREFFGAHTLCDTGCIVAVEDDEGEDSFCDDEEKQEQTWAGGKGGVCGNKVSCIRHGANVALAETDTMLQPNGVFLRMKSNANTCMEDAPGLRPASNDFKNSWSGIETTDMDNHHALGLMRERVQRIRALIEEDVEQEKRRCKEREGGLLGGFGHNTGAVGDKKKDYNDDGDQRRFEGWGMREHTAAKPTLTSCREKVRPEQQQAEGERAGFGQSSKLSVNCALPMDEKTSEFLQQAPCFQEIKRDIFDETANSCFVTPGDSENEDERFTVNVCMSEDYDCPAVVVPQESSLSDEKPPAPPPSSFVHNVDRLCFDSSLSDTTSHVPPHQSSVVRSTVLMTKCGEEESEEEKGKVPLSAPLAGVKAPTAIPSHAAQGQRIGVFAHYGRLGERAAVNVAAPVDGFRFYTRTASTTPGHSLQLSCGEDEESSVSMQDYRRLPMSGSRGRSAAAMNSTGFMRLGSLYSDDENANVGDEDVHPAPQQQTDVVLFPPCSPSRQKMQEPQKQLQGDYQKRSTPQLPSMSLLLPEAGFRLDDTGKNVVQQKKFFAKKNAGASCVHREFAPLFTELLSEDPEGLDCKGQPFETVSGLFVFDPLLQCCLDLKSNTYVAGTGPLQEGKA